MSLTTDTRTLRVDIESSAVIRYTHNRIVELVCEEIAKRIADDLYPQVLAAVDVKALATLVLTRSAVGIADQFAAMKLRDEKPRG